MDKDKIKTKASLREGANEAANDRARASIQKGIDDLVRRLEEIEVNDELSAEEKREHAQQIKKTIANWLGKWESA